MRLRKGRRRGRYPGSWLGVLVFGEILRHVNEKSRFKGRKCLGFSSGLIYVTYMYIAAN